MSQRIRYETLTKLLVEKEICVKEEFVSGEMKGR
jgi:hypothetical protein